MDMIVEFLQGLNIWWWLGLAGVLLIGELITGTTYLLWPAVAAVLTGLFPVLFPGMEWPFQLVMFSILSVAFLFLGDRYLRPHLKAGSDSGLNSRATYLVGESVTVVAGFSSGRGRVRHGDTEWSAKTGDGSDLDEGAKARVQSINGTTLIVGD